MYSICLKVVGRKDYMVLTLGSLGDIETDQTRNEG
jgi:hypothetical protein